MAQMSSAIPLGPAQDKETPDLLVPPRVPRGSSPIPAGSRSLTGCQERRQDSLHRLGWEARALGTVFQRAPVEKHLKSTQTGRAVQEIGEASENPDAGWHPAGQGGETAPEVTAKGPGQPSRAPGTGAGEGGGGRVALGLPLAATGPSGSSEQSLSGLFWGYFNIKMAVPAPRNPASLESGPGTCLSRPRKHTTGPGRTFQPPWNRYSSKTGSHSHGSHQPGGRPGGAGARTPRGSPATAPAPSAQGPPWGRQRPQTACRPHPPPRYHPRRPPGPDSGSVLKRSHQEPLESPAK